MHEPSKAWVRYDLIFWPVTVPKLSQNYPSTIPKICPGRQEGEGRKVLAGRQEGVIRQAGRQAGRNEGRQQGRKILRTSGALVGGGVYAGSMWDL